MAASVRGRVPTPIDEYIASARADVQPVLRELRDAIRTVVPGAEERLSYRMPAFFLDGALVYFAAFKRHIGIFPPVKGDAALSKRLEPYRGPKGNFQFPLDEPLPYPLIRRLVRARLREHRARLAARPVWPASRAKRS